MIRNAIVLFHRDVEGGEFQNTERILDELGVIVINIEDCQHIRDICKAVSERAAFLASAGETLNSRLSSNQSLVFISFVFVFRIIFR